MKQLWRGAIVLGVASVFALGYAVNGLADGITELPRHWWSAAPVVGLLVAGALGTAVRLRERTDHRP